LYDSAARPLVVGFKHHDRTHAAATYAAWMARAGERLLAEADLIVPVPLHRRRLFVRRFNQAALLARALGRRTGGVVVLSLLQRQRATPPQVGLDRATRLRNLRGAFRVRPGLEGRVGGQRVLMIDDVLTTGATLDECAKTLLAAGAVQVDALTLARVPEGPA